MDCVDAEDERTALLMSPQSSRSATAVARHGTGQGWSTAQMFLIFVPSLMMVYLASMLVSDADEFLGMVSQFPFVGSMHKRKMTFTLYTACSPLDELKFDVKKFDGAVGARVATKSKDNELGFWSGTPMTEISCGTFQADVHIYKGEQFGFWLYPTTNETESHLYSSSTDAQIDGGCEAKGSHRCKAAHVPAPLVNSTCTKSFPVYYLQKGMGHDIFWNRVYDGKSTSFVWGSCDSECIAHQPPTCESCEVGQYVSNHECKQCAPGTTSNGGPPAGPDTSCDAIVCGVNTHVSNNICEPCPPGTRSSGNFLATGSDNECQAIRCAIHQHVFNNTCIACAAGSENEAGDDASSVNTVCDAILCGENEHVASNQCVACPAGHTHSAGDDASGGDTSCDQILCSAGQFVQNNTCVACEPGSTNSAGDSAAGNDTDCDITFCEVNMRVNNHVCVPCAPGKSNPSGNPATGEDTTCTDVICGANERVQSHICVSCPPGTTNTIGHAASGVDTKCDVTNCGLNQHVVGHNCVECPAGTSNEAGDDASLADTDCDDILCAVNEHVVNNTCVACPSGHDHPGGDAASGADTSCDVITCGANERVRSNTCIACPPGTTSIGGDEATASDTTCLATSCRENQHVESNVCVNCASGLENPAGDDASGADTSCSPPARSTYQWSEKQAATCRVGANLKTIYADVSLEQCKADCVANSNCRAIVYLEGPENGQNQYPLDGRCELWPEGETGGSCDTTGASSSGGPFWNGGVCTHSLCNGRKAQDTISQHSYYEFGPRTFHLGSYANPTLSCKSVCTSHGQKPIGPGRVNADCGVNVYSGNGASVNCQAPHCGSMMGNNFPESPNFSRNIHWILKSNSAWMQTSYEIFDANDKCVVASQQCYEAKDISSPHYTYLLGRRKNGDGDKHDLRVNGGGRACCECQG